MGLHHVHGDDDGSLVVVTRSPGSPVKRHIPENWQGRNVTTRALES